MFHLGLNTAVIIDEKSAANEATNPVGTGPYKLAAWNKGVFVTLDKWDGFRDPAKIAIAHAKFGFISDPSAEVAAMLAGDIDAFPRFAGYQNIAQFQNDPRFQVLIGGTEGKTILGDEQQAQAARRSARASGDRLRDRPQGDHRRRDERVRRRRSAATSRPTIPAMSI